MNDKLTPHEGCHLHTLAKGSTAHLQRCLHCGTLALHLGPLSLRFDAAALESLWCTLGDALVQLHAELDAEPAQRVRRVGRA